MDILLFAVLLALAMASIPIPCIIPRILPKCQYNNKITTKVILIIIIAKITE